MRFALLAPLAAACVATGWCPTTVEAQSIPSPFSFIEARQEAGPYIGVMSAATGRFGYGPKGGLLYGGRWGFELSGPVSLEAVAGMVDGTRDVINPGRVEGDRVVGSADVRLATVDARLKFSLTGDRTWHRLAPFLVAGGGVAFDVAGKAVADGALEPADRFDFRTSFFGTAGGGVRWFTTEHVALRTDGVFSLWKLHTPPGFSDPARSFTGVAESEWASGTSITLAVLFRW